MISTRKQLSNYLTKILSTLLFVCISLLIWGEFGIKFGLDALFLFKAIFLIVILLLIPVLKEEFFQLRTPNSFFKKNADIPQAFQKGIAGFLTKKWISLAALPIFLLILGTVLSFANLFYAEEGFSVLIQEQKRSNLVSWKTDELLSGEKISGEFKAIENNLGIVAVRFNTFKRINDDFLKFKLKEKGEDEWYYESKYKVDQFQDDKFFPFGFSKISDSRKKVYQFEIESTKGKPGNAVAISPNFPVFQTKYQFIREDLLVDKAAFINFVLSKFFNTTFNSKSSYAFLLSIFVFFTPFFFYLFCLLKNKPLFNLAGVESFFSVVLLTFLFVKLGARIGELVSSNITFELFSNNFLSLASNCLLIWIVITGAILALACKRP